MASFFVLPSDILRSMKRLVRSSCDILATAISCIARFACLSPPRFSLKLPYGMYAIAGAFRFDGDDVAYANLGAEADGGEYECGRKNGSGLPPHSPMSPAKAPP